MSKEYLETLSKNIKFKKEFVGNDTYRLYLKKNDIELLEKELQRLEAIDNANPSEALEIIRKCISSNYLNTWHPKFVEDLKTVENYILKAQKQEKLLNAIVKKNINTWRFKADADIDYEYYKSNSILYHNVVYNNLLTEEEFNSLVTFISNLFQ